LENDDLKWKQFTGSDKFDYPIDYAAKGPGDIHTEIGDPEGALVLFNPFTTDDQLADTLAEDGTVLSHSTLSQRLHGRSAR
jgi:hypothetical protein